MATVTQGEEVGCKVVLANSIAKSLLEEVLKGVTGLGKKPLLVGFLATQDPAAQVYAQWTGKTCREK
jgi:methylenetetrahydrofolate dehydrogenase (NAD+)